MADPIPLPVPPVVKRIVIGLEPERAFDRFTARMSDWWPTATHSVSRDPRVTVSMEPGIGGRLVERDGTGAEHVWGRITVWNPPRQVGFTWHPGRPSATAQQVTVSFSPEGKGKTAVELVHSGWETLGADALAVREDYEAGWQGVFEEAYAGISGEQ